MYCKKIGAKNLPKIIKHNTTIFYYILIKRISTLSFLGSAVQLRKKKSNTSRIHL